MKIKKNVSYVIYRNIFTLLLFNISNCFCSFKINFDLKNLLNFIAFFSEMFKIYCNQNNKSKDDQLDKLCFKMFNPLGVNLDYPTDESIKVEMIENGYKDSVKQINSILNHILKNQIKKSFVKTSKYYEI